MSTIPHRKESVRQRRFTKAEYYRLGELGFFQGQRVELIGGRLMVASPQNAPHSTCVYLVEEGLQKVLGAGYMVRCQLPLDLGSTSEVEPDLAVVEGELRSYSTSHPTRAELVVEVSDTSLAYDRRKGGLYACAGLPEYWIVNLAQRQVEFYRDPIADAGEPFGHRFASRSDLQSGGVVSPLTRPSARIAVADLLP